MNNQSSCNFYFINKCINLYNDSYKSYDGTMYSNKIDDIEIVITKRGTETYANIGTDDIDIFYYPNVRIYIKVEEKYSLCMKYPFVKITKYNNDSNSIEYYNIPELKQIGNFSEDELFYLELKYGEIFT